MEVTNHLVSWLITYWGNLQPTYVGAIIHFKFHLLSTMDIPVPLKYQQSYERRSQHLGIVFKSSKHFQMYSKRANKIAKVQFSHGSSFPKVFNETLIFSRI